MKRFLSKIDWWIILSLVPLLILSLSTISSFGVDNSESFFLKQMMWFFISFVVLGVSASFDLSFLKKSKNIMLLYGFGVALLIFLLFATSCIA